MLPFYIIRKIIERISDYININNRLLTITSQKIKEIQILILNCSMVSWSWFKILSSLINTKSLNINIDNNCEIQLFNFQFSIIKLNNINSLSISFNHNNNNNDNIKINNQLIFINIKIKSLIKNLKFLKELFIIINRLSINSNQLNWINYKEYNINYLFDIPFNNISISSLIINNKFNKIPLNLKYTNEIIINEQPNDKLILFKLFKFVKFNKLTINNNINSLNSILKQVFYYNNLIYSTINNNNNNNVNKRIKTNLELPLSNLINTFKNNNNNNNIFFKELINLNCKFIQLESLYNLIKFSPNLNYLSFQLCYFNLIYCLSTSNDRNESFYCSCTNNSNGSGSFESFLNLWNLFSLEIINHNNLIYFKLSNSCPLKQSQQQQQKINKLPISFIENFSKIFIKNSSIKKLCLLNFNTNQLHDYIILNNTKFTYYKSLFQN